MRVRRSRTLGSSITSTPLRRSPNPDLPGVGETGSGRSSLINTPPDPGVVLVLERPARQRAAGVQDEGVAGWPLAVDQPVLYQPEPVVLVGDQQVDASPEPDRPSVGSDQAGPRQPGVGYDDVDLRADPDGGEVVQV